MSHRKLDSAIAIYSGFIYSLPNVILVESVLFYGYFYGEDHNVVYYFAVVLSGEDEF